jgi:GNAT superfamily N-acetyltransferase
MHSHDREVELDQLVSLYDSVGWLTYTRDPEALRRAVLGSTFVVTDWDGPTLIGLARGLSDDVSIFYLQDILVRPSHQRRGVASGLLEACLERFEHVRQKVLLTDNDEAQAALYTRFGFVRTVDFEDAPLNAYVRFDRT